MPNYISKLSVDNVLALIRDTAAQTLCANLRNDLTNETSARENADNAETSARENAVSAINGRIDTEISNREEADTNIRTTLNTEITDRKNADTEIKSAVNKNTSDIANINSKLNSLSNKTEVILFGDSWADYNTDPDNVRIPQTITELTGLNVHNYAKSGTGFTPQGGYMDQLDEFNNDTTFDHNKVGYCLLIAGLNEYVPMHSKESFVANLKNWVDKARTMTNAEIIWLFDYSMVNEERENNFSTKFYAQLDYFNYIKNNVNRLIKCVNMMGWVRFDRIQNNWNTNNWYHPTADGSKDIGRNIVRTMLNLPPIIYTYAYALATWSADNGNENINKMHCEFYISGEYLRCRATTPLCANGIGQSSQVKYPLTFTHQMPSIFFDYSCVTNYMFVTSDNTINRIGAEYYWSSAVSGYVTSDFLTIR